MSNDKILIVDDEPQICKLLEINLQANKFDTLTAENAKMGLALAASYNPDLILLDIELPDQSGHELLLNLRQWYTKAIIMLSVLNTEFDIVKALDNGADDYLCKPFRSAELLARVRNAIKRHAHENNEQHILVFDDITIDVSARLLTKNDQAIKLTATEYDIILLLAKHHGRVLTQQFMLKQIWGLNAQTEAQYLRVFIAAIRKKIEDNPASPKHIITESGIGYRFV